MIAGPPLGGSGLLLQQLAQHPSFVPHLDRQRPALHNALHNRYIRLTDRAQFHSGHDTADSTIVDSSTPHGADFLPDSWAWERFTVVDGGNGQIALHNAANNRFVRMTPSADPTEPSVSGSTGSSAARRRASPP